MSKKNQDYIDYAAMLHLAMLGVVRQVLTQVSKAGLPQNHSFYISFLSSKETMLKYRGQRDNDPSERDIIVGDYLLNKYGEEITIVIEHQYKNLLVDDFGFSIELSFNSQYQKLYIPFTYMTKFIDPSVNFALDFLPQRNKQGDLQQNQTIEKSPVEKPATKANTSISNNNIKKFILPIDKNKELRLVDKKQSPKTNKPKSHKVLSFKRFSKKTDKEDS